MEDLTISLPLLSLLFSLVAFFYAAVGLGGGSSYTALLAIFGASTMAIPVISLTLNILVTSFGSITFFLKGHTRIRLILPFLLSSIPMAYIGGMLQLPREMFYLLLICSLAFAAYRIYSPVNITPRQLSPRVQISVALLSGALLGLVAGITGIGGGIYLVPLIILLGLGSAKEAAACGALFIFVNSISGLAARMSHNHFDLVTVWPLIVCTVLAGITGSLVGAGRLSPRVMQKILGSILIIAVVMLVEKLWSSL